MFDKFKLQRKLNAFRRDGVECTSYDPDKRVIALKSGSGHKAELAFKLAMHDQQLLLAFSGDAISGDGEALSRVMKVMWNQQLPTFDNDAELRKQLGKPLPDPAVVSTPSEEGGSTAVAPVEASDPLYFRDMASFVAGMPNEVVVTVKSSYRIDNA